MKHSVYTVAQINSYIKNMFTQDFLLQNVFVKGEVSNCKYHTSGHIYFTLKDRKGTMACVMFAGNRNGLNFQLKEGMQVVVSGSVDVYERDGKYQLYAKEITLDGEGALYEKFEQLKNKLEEMGMFAEEYKRPIPKYIKTLGVVTAPTGAAVRDIIQISKRRNPYIQIILYPAVVQGENAPASIIKGIYALEHIGVDAMIVGRGGGSIEDLWAFNEEEVAKAIFNCQVPVISAVGHETDFTIADFVADLRASTPSAAAELAVADRMELEERMSAYSYSLYKYMKNKLAYETYKYSAFETRMKYLSPLNQIKQKRMYGVELEKRLEKGIWDKVSYSQNRLHLNAEIMKRLSPINKLESGFSYVHDTNGKCLKKVEQFQKGDEVYIQVLDGLVKTQVLDIKKIDRE